MNAWMIRYGVHGSSRPGFSTTGTFSANRRHPERVDARRVAGQHHAQRVRHREEADRHARLLADALVDHLDGSSPRVSPRRIVGISREDLVDLRHVAAGSERVRQPAGRGERLDVLLGRLRAAPSPSGRSASMNALARLARRSRAAAPPAPPQRLPRRAHPPQVPPDEPRVRLAHPRWAGRLAGADARSRLSYGTPLRRMGMCW